MGLFDGLFGGSSGEVENNGPTNPAEEFAAGQYLSEAFMTEEDPIPAEPPSWAENLPSPVDSDTK